MLANFMDKFITPRKTNAATTEEALRILDNARIMNSYFLAWVAGGAGVMGLFWITYILGSHDGALMPMAIMLAVTSLAVAAITLYHRNQSSALIANLSELIHDKHTVPTPGGPVHRKALHDHVNDLLAAGMEEPLDHSVFDGRMTRLGPVLPDVLTVLPRRPLDTGIAAQRARRLPKSSKVESDPHVHHFHRDDDEHQKTIFDRYLEVRMEGDPPIETIQEMIARYSAHTDTEPVNTGPETQPFGIQEKSTTGKHRAG